MVEVVSADLLLRRDTLSPGLLKSGRAAADASGNMRQLTRDIYELSKTRATPVVDLKDAAAMARLDKVAAKLRDLSSRSAQASVDIKDKDALAKIAGMRVRLDDLGKKVSSPRVTLEGLARAEAGIAALDAQLDRLGRKDVHPKVKVEFSGLQRLRNISAGPSLIAGLGPAAIPAAAGLIPILGAVTASFAGAAAGAGAFGAMAKTTFTEAGKDAKKLAQLNEKLNTAQARLDSAKSASAKKAARDQVQAVRDQIKALQQGWTPAYRKVMAETQNIKDRWKSTSIALTAPVLVPWLHIVSSAMGDLRVLVKPVAIVFRSWGEDIDRYFSSKAGSSEIRRMSAELGNFAGGQLGDIGEFIHDIGTGVMALGRDIAGNGVNFGAFGADLQSWGAAFAGWAKSNAARRDVREFLQFARREGHQVGEFLAAAGGALKNIAPGLTSAGVLELRVMTDFLTMVAHLPPKLATRLTELAVGALALAKPVGLLVSAGASLGKLPGLLRRIGILGPSAAAGGMQRAGDTMLAASRNMQAAADTMAGAGGAAGKGGGWKRIIPFGSSALPAGAAVVATAAGLVLVGKAAYTRARQPGGLFQPQGEIAGSVQFRFTGRFGPYKPLVDAVRHADSATRSAFADMKDIADEKSTAMRAVVLRQFGATDSQVRDKLSRLSHATGVAFTDIRDMASEKAGAMKNAVTGHFDTMRSRASGTVDRLHDHVARQFGAMDSKVASLSKTLENIPRHISTSISVSGTGSWHLTRIGAGLLPSKPAQKGWRIPGYGGGDTVPIMAERGEAIVPKHLVPEMAPWARMRGIPGFQAGGVVGSYSDGVAGERAWAVRELRASERAIAAGLARAITQATAITGSGALGGDERVNEALARAMFPWPSSQWPAFVALEMAEAGFNRFARNPSSGAYGMPQALPPTKMPFAAQAAGGSHAGPQLSFMYGYIGGRYGDPASAWAHEQAFHWYGKGGVAGYAAGGLVAPGSRAWSVGAIPPTERPPVSLPGSSLARMQAVAHAALAALQKNEVADYLGLRRAFLPGPPGVTAALRAAQGSEAWHAAALERLPWKGHAARERIRTFTGHQEAIAKAWAAYRKRQTGESWSRYSGDVAELAGLLGGASYTSALRGEHPGWYDAAAASLKGLYAVIHPHVPDTPATRWRREHSRFWRADLEHLARLQERETAAFKAVAGGDVTFVNLAALMRAVGLESAGLRGMGALSHVPGGHPGWAGGLAWWLRGLRAAAGTARTALGAQFHVYDSGGWLPPGVSVAVNRTSRPEMVVPAGRAGAAPTVVVNLDVKVAPGAHPGEVGRQVASALNEYFRGGGKISNGRGRSFP